MKKKEARYKNAKSKKAKKNAKRRLDQARKKATARDQMIQTAENVQDNFETMPETAQKKILKDVADSAGNKLLEMVLDYKNMLQIFGKRDEHAQQVANEKVMTRLANRALKMHLKAGNYDKATIDQLSDLDTESPQMQELIDTLHNRALEAQTQQKEKDSKSTPQEIAKFTQDLNTKGF